MKIFLKYAKRLNIGQTLKIEHTPEDPKNPYHFLSADLFNN